jgi:pimeloyl-ACP methyl ester carboxylesterase
VTKGFPESISDVACSVRWARRTARRYGGDPRHLVLVGHSQGGYVSAMVSLAGDTFPGRRGDCLVRRGDSLPEGFVSVAGVSAVHPEMLLDQIYFGGRYEEIPRVWRRGTIDRYMGRNRALKVGIVFERNDPILGIGHATHLARAFRAHGYRTKLVLLDEGWTHFDILNADGAIGRRVVQVIERVVRWSRPAPKRRA